MQHWFCTVAAVGVLAVTANAATAQSFRDCDNICPEMTVLAAGDFIMGSPPGEEGRDASEGPQRRVTIARSFALGRYEVTTAEWAACVSDRGCSRRIDAPTGREPVRGLSWSDAQQYVRWLSRRTGHVYRLPSEAEWEYAARAGSTQAYATGALITPGRANFGGGMLSGDARDVGAFPANAFGLHDMHGNVAEWVEDCWSPTYSGAPIDGSARQTGDCAKRILRGGDWQDAAPGLRSARRHWASRDFPMPRVGLRVARDI